MNLQVCVLACFLHVNAAWPRSIWVPPPGQPHCASDTDAKPYDQASYTHFFHGINSYYLLCATNAGARWILGRTFHAACGLGAKAALHTPALLLTGDKKKRLESALQHVACVAGDEVSQVSAPLLHASNLRFMYARMWKHSLNAEEVEGPQATGDQRRGTLRQSWSSSEELPWTCWQTTMSWSGVWMHSPRSNPLSQVRLWGG